jgi:N-acetylglucosamine repressor
MKKATRQQTKEHNRNLILRLLFENASISRAEISRITGLTRTTVSEIVADLIGEGLVAELGPGESMGGKTPILLGLVEDSRYFIGLDLARNRFSGAIVNLRGKIIQRIDLPEESNAEKALALVFKILDSLIGLSIKPLAGIGVGAPGLVNSAEGVVVNAVNLDWQNLPLARLLQERYRLPVAVLNDSQAAAMGEFAYGEGHSAEDSLVVINVRYGIGAGIIIHGSLFQGDGGGAGEIGHVVVQREGGLLCRCGNTGCLETVASVQAVEQRALQLMRKEGSHYLSSDRQTIDLDDLENAFRNGDPAVRQAVLESGQALGTAISNLVGALNIQTVVLSGELTRFGEPWLDAIRKTMVRTGLQRLTQNTRIEIGKLGPNNIVLGASAVLLRNYSLLFNQPSS